MAIIIQPTLQGFSSSLDTTAPNDAVPVALFEATGGATNIDAAMVPKGTGAILAQIPDNTSTGGNKRGTRAVDFQRQRSQASHVASGTESVIAGGSSNSAAGTNSTVSGGTANSANGDYSTTGGGSQNNINTVCTASTIGGGTLNTVSTGNDYATIGGGYSNQVNALNGAVGGGSQNRVDTGATNGCVPGGAGGSARYFGKFAFSSDATYGTGGAQWSASSLKGESANGVAYVLRASGSAVSDQMPDNSSFAFTGVVVARDNATGDTAAWTVQGVLRRATTAASVTLIANAVTLIGADAGAAAWVCALAANTTIGQGGLDLSVTGAVGVTVRAHATLHWSELDMS